MRDEGMERVAAAVTFSREFGRPSRKEHNTSPMLRREASVALASDTRCVGVGTSMGRSTKMIPQRSPTLSPAPLAGTMSPNRSAESVATMRNARPPAATVPRGVDSRSRRTEEGQAMRASMVDVDPFPAAISKSLFVPAAGSCSASSESRLPLDGAPNARRYIAPVETVATAATDSARCNAKTSVSTSATTCGDGHAQVDDRGNADADMEVSREPSLVRNAEPRSPIIADISESAPVLASVK